MRKVLRVGVIAAAFALTAWIGVVALAQSSTTAPTTGPTTSSPAVDDGDQFKGPCDEAEHAGDPECQGVTLVPEDNGADDNGGNGQMEPGDDNGGQGEIEPGDDNGGQGEIEPGDDNGGQGENEGDDDSGPSQNSGPGSEDSGHGSDDSGHGGDDD
jgi:hypothetical protein